MLEFDLLAGNRLFYVHLLRDGLVEEVERYEEKARRGEEEGAGPKMVREEPLEWEEWGVNECRLFEAEIPVQRSWVSRRVFGFLREEKRRETDCRVASFFVSRRSLSLKATEPSPIDLLVQFPRIKTSS